MATAESRAAQARDHSTVPASTTSHHVVGSRETTLAGSAKSSSTGRTVSLTQYRNSSRPTVVGMSGGGGSPEASSAEHGCKKFTKRLLNAVGSNASGSRTVERPGCCLRQVSSRSSRTINLGETHVPIPALLHVELWRVSRCTCGGVLRSTS